MNLFAVALVYAGLLLSFLGGVSVLWPLRFLGIRTRVRGVLVALAGLLVFVAGESLPTSEFHVAQATTHFDALMPVYQFNEVHRAVIAAPRDSVYLAIQMVRANDIHFFKELIWLRRMARRGTRTTLAQLPTMPLLELLTRAGFMSLADEPGREIVIGTLVQAPPGWTPPEGATPEGYRDLSDPGFVKAAMNFHLEDAPGGGCAVTTETRVYATDPASKTVFARYWRVIYPGSALIRRMWLGAIQRRAVASTRLGG